MKWSKWIWSTTATLALVGLMGGCSDDTDRHAGPANPTDTGDLVEVVEDDVAQTRPDAADTSELADVDDIDTEVAPLDPLFEPRELPAAQSVAAGGAFGCAVVEGDAHCWGHNANGRAAAPSRAAFVEVVATGQRGGCGVKQDGTVECWGNGQVEPLVGEDYADVAGVLTGMCAVTTQGTLRCQPGVARDVPRGDGFAKIVVGSQWCALGESGSVTCWPLAATLGGNPALLSRDDTSFSQLTMADHTICGLTAQGRAECWGEDTNGKASPPTDETFARISLGKYHGCGATEDGRVVCWGVEQGLQRGYVTPPAGLADIVDVAVGDRWACALDSAGHAECWGADSMAIASLPAGLELSSISIHPGSGTGCGLTVDQEAFCWRFDDTDTFGWAPTGAAFVEVTAGKAHGCGLKEDGTFSCWGDLWQGEQKFVGDAFVEVDAGHRTTCARRANGSVSCWGGLGAPSFDDFVTIDVVDTIARHACGVRDGGQLHCWGLSPDHGGQQPTGAFRDVSAGWNRNCAVRESGALVCWDSESTDATDPPRGDDFVEVEVGFWQSCARRASGEVVCWGEQSTPYPADQSFASLDVAGDGTCALTNAGQVVCRGSIDTPRWLSGVARIDAHGATLCWLTSEHTGRCNNAIEDSPTSDLEAVSAGKYHACSLRPDGRVSCWNRGYSYDGELDVPTDAGFVAVSASAFGGCALGDDGSAQCWGADSAGGIAPAPHEDYVLLDAEGRHHCGVRQAGGVDCWSYPDLEFLDPMADLPASLPEPLALAIGGEHGCVLDAAGEVHCFGQILAPTGCAQDRQGQVYCWGDPQNSDRFAQLACGSAHCCALDTDGHPLCWGESSLLPVPSERFVEIAAGEGYTCGTRADHSLRCWGAFVADSW